MSRSDEDKFGRPAAAAKAAAERLDRARGVQLALLPEAAPVPAEAEGARRGRPPGARNKASAGLRDMLAARGHRMPEDVLAQLAGLGTRDDPFQVVMARAEQLLAWAGTSATPGMRLKVALDVLGETRRAAEALLPYGLAKVTPDTASAVTNVLVMPSAPVAPGDGARVVDGSATGRTAPPPLPEEIKRLQALARAEAAQSDGGSRTE